MKSMQKFKKGDILLILTVVILGIAVAVPTLAHKFYAGNPPSNEPLIAVISRDGKTITEIDLNKVQEPQSFNFDEGIHVRIVAEKGTIRFVEADCPDKICIKTGTLTRPGDRAVCMPSKTIVTLKGEGTRVGLFAKQVVIYE